MEAFKNSMSSMNGRQQVEHLGRVFKMLPPTFVESRDEFIWEVTLKFGGVKTKGQGKSLREARDIACYKCVDEFLAKNDPTTLEGYMTSQAKKDSFRKIASEIYWYISYSVEKHTIVMGVRGDDYIVIESRSAFYDPAPMMQIIANYFDQLTDLNEIMQKYYLLADGFTHDDSFEGEMASFIPNARKKPNYREHLEDMLKRLTARVEDVEKEEVQALLKDAEEFIDEQQLDVVEHQVKLEAAHQAILQNYNSN